MQVLKHYPKHEWQMIFEIDEQCVRNGIGEQNTRTHATGHMRSRKHTNIPTCWRTFSMCLFFFKEKICCWSVLVALRFDFHFLCKFVTFPYGVRFVHVDSAQTRQAHSFLFFFFFCNLSMFLHRTGMHRTELYHIHTPLIFTPPGVSPSVRRIMSVSLLQFGKQVNETQNQLLRTTHTGWNIVSTFECPVLNASLLSYHT